MFFTFFCALKIFFYFCRRVGPGQVIIMMTAILVFTYICIKVKAPSIPKDHTEDGFMKGLVVMAISWIGALVAFGAFGEYTRIEEFFISQCIANIFCNVLIPMYFIYSTPNLCKYVKSLWHQPSHEHQQDIPMVLNPPNIIVTRHFWTYVVRYLKNKIGFLAFIIYKCLHAAKKPLQF